MGASTVVRMGRTTLKGNKQLKITVLSPSEFMVLYDLQHFGPYKKEIELTTPEYSLVVSLKAAGLINYEQVPIAGSLKYELTMSITDAGQAVLREYRGPYAR